MSFVWTSPKGGLQYRMNLPNLTGALQDISDLPFVQILSTKSSRYLEVELNASITSA